jgi:long-chain fatty acid transport protein
MFKNGRGNVLKTVMIGLLFAGNAYATNGYFAHGIGVNEKAMAGAGVAYSTDTLAAGNNPAGMVRQGNAMNLGVSLFAPSRNYSSQGGPSAPVGTPCGANCPFSIGDGDQSIESENEQFLIPQYGQNWMLDSQSSIGVSLFGNGGMNTEYKGGSALLGPAGTTVELPGTYGSGTAGVNLEQLFFATTYSQQVSENYSWGISGILAYQTFEATGLGNFAGFSSNPGKLSNQGKDTASGIGIRLGAQGKVSEAVSWGVAFQPKIDMGEFDDYAGLFADKGDFDIPSTWTFGIAWEIGNGKVLVVDVQSINYSDIAAISNTISPLADGSCIPGPTGGTGNGCLGGSNGAGFGWDDMTIIKLGYEWAGEQGWTWRAGYSHADQPIADTELLFNILAPGVIEDHFTFGFSKQLMKAGKIEFAIMIAPEASQTGSNTFDPAQSVEIAMDQFELALGYSRSF